MQKFFRNLAVSVAVLLCGIILYQSTTNVYALPSIDMITGSFLTYTWETYTPTIIFGWGSWDIWRIYLTDSANSWDLSIYSGTTIISEAMSFWAPWSPILTIGTAFLNYTWTNLWLHGFIYYAGPSTGYLGQEIVFVPYSGADWAAIYGGIHDTLVASGIANNFDEITGGNVTAFSWLYFGKLSWADELGRITFPMALDLTDSGVQTLLQNLWNEDLLRMHEGYIIFSPGANDAMNTGATITMNFGVDCDFISGINNADDFIVFSSTWQQLNPSDVIDDVTAVYGGNSWYITFSASHFTQFSLNPKFTLLSISSSNAVTGYATSWDTITINLAFDTVADSVSDAYISIWGVSNPFIFTWAGKTRSWTYVVTTWDSGPITLDIQTVDFTSTRFFRTEYSSIPNIYFPATDWSFVMFEVNPITTWGTYTGKAYLVWATSVAYTSNINGILKLYANGTDYISVDLSWLVITTDTWDGILGAPVEDDAAVLGETWLPSSSTNNGTTTTNRTILLTMQAGATNGASLSVSPNFWIEFEIVDWTSGDILHIYRSVDGTTWEANDPTETCTLDADKLCGFFTNHLSYFTTIKETTTTNSTNNGGWGGWSSIQKDSCPNGDTSASFYDGKCSTTDTTTAPHANWSIIWSSFSEELNNAYLYAFEKWITTMPTIQEADMEGALIRSHMAKMMVNYAVKVALLHPDATKECIFDDVSNQSTEIKWYITLACQLGLMGIDMTNFEPDTIVTRAQFGTILSRILYGNEFNGGMPYYENHLNALKSVAIMTKIENPERVNELRGRVMLMLMRASK